MIQHTSEQQKQDENQQKYEKTQMQREIVIQRLKEQGCRITKQRMVHPGSIPKSGLRPCIA